METTIFSEILEKLDNLEDKISNIEASVAFIREDIDHFKAYVGYDESTGIIKFNNNPLDEIHDHVKQVKSELQDTINSAANLVNNNIDSSIASLRTTVKLYAP